MPASKCKFVVNFEEALQDQFVCGLQTEAVQKRLLTKADLKFACVVKIAVGMEAAAQKVRMPSAGI